MSDNFYTGHMDAFDPEKHVNKEDYKEAIIKAYNVGFKAGIAKAATFLNEHNVKLSNELENEFIYGPKEEDHEVD